MKTKLLLILLTLVPILTGHIINWSISLATIGTVILYIVPLAVVVFWFWLGTRYSKTNWKPIVAILIGNLTGILSLLLYVWQFLLVSDENRDFALAGLSQMFTTSVPVYLYSSIVGLFANLFGGNYMLTIIVIALIIMIIIFTLGYLFGKKSLTKRSS